jgi:hypothetical protein
MQKKPWFDVLLSARRILSRGEVLTSIGLAGESGIETRIASAWLFKFERWGYVLRKEKVATRKRWSWSWSITTWGTKARVKGYRAKVDRPKMAANPKEERE